jgi:protein phosphatase methylesterase 1
LDTGGAVVANVASKQMLKKIFGLIVIDVVEGTALESLVHMQTVLMGRPASFKSEAEAIKWSIASHTIRNIESAKISVPSQITKIKGKTGERYIWRTNLSASEKYWEEWYQGLSEKFLSTRAPKLLIIASPDRLDKPLTIGQMQGKFQMEIFPECGHLMNEDAPEKLAVALNEFFKRNKVFIPKRFVIPLRPTEHATAPKK